jgi:aminoglycoside phosphotransferase (APT) family kinase protein
MAQWTADIDIDASVAAGLIATQFPDFAEASVEPFGSGWDNAAFLIDRRIVFRFPRRRIAAKLIEREIAVLPQLAGRLPLAISAPSYIGRKAAAFPWPFAGYELISGTTSCSVLLSDCARAALAAPLAQFLRALHDIDTRPFVAAGVPPDEIGRLDHEKRFRFARERAAAFTELGYLDDVSYFLQWLEAHPPRPFADEDRRIVHGDLYARHVLIDDRSVPCGVIDWGDVHLGDPALDIAIAHLILPSSAHAAFRSCYGPIDEPTWNAARYRAIYHAILELDYGLRENDGGMRDSGETALRLIRG